MQICNNSVTKRKKVYEDLKKRYENQRRRQIFRRKQTRRLNPSRTKSSRELRKHLLRKASLIQMYTPAPSYNHEERQSRHSWKAHTSSSSEEGSQDQESINEAYTIEKVYAKNSKFSFKIKDPLSIAWDKSQRHFILRCPYYFKMEKLLHKIKKNR